MLYPIVGIRIRSGGMLRLPCLWIVRRRLLSFMLWTWHFSCSELQLGGLGVTTWGQRYLILIWHVSIVLSLKVLWVSLLCGLETGTDGATGGCLGVRSGNSPGICVSCECSNSVSWEREDSEVCICKGFSWEGIGSVMSSIACLNWSRAVMKDRFVVAHSTGYVYTLRLWFRLVDRFTCTCGMEAACFLIRSLVSFAKAVPIRMPCIEKVA